MELGNELQAGHVSLAKFHALLTRRMPFLGHIKLNTVTVVNHLGDIIPVPNIFCSAWEVGFIFIHIASKLTSSRARIFIMLSADIAKDVSETDLSPGVIICLYELPTAR